MRNIKKNLKKKLSAEIFTHHAKHWFTLMFQTGLRKEKTVSDLEEELSRLKAVNKDLYEFAVNEILDSENKVS